MLIAVNYHYLRPAGEPAHAAIHPTTPGELVRQVDRLARCGTFVSAADIVDALDGRRPLPPRALLLTFDDGLAEQFAYGWPVLVALGVPAVFFANTAPLVERRLAGVHRIHFLRAHCGPDVLRSAVRGAPPQCGPQEAAAMRERAVAHYRYDDPDTAELKYLLNFVLDPEERDRRLAGLFAEALGRDESEAATALYMDWDALGALAAAGCLGCHTHRHLPLGRLAPEVAEAEVADSMRLLTERTGVRPAGISYPYGSKDACGPVVADAAARAGCRFGFTMERAGNRDLRRPLLLARIDHNDAPGGKAARWTTDDLFDAIGASRWWEEEAAA